jgi:hypothetical protein
MTLLSIRFVPVALVSLVLMACAKPAQDGGERRDTLSSPLVMYYPREEPALVLTFSLDKSNLRITEFRDGCQNNTNVLLSDRQVSELKAVFTKEKVSHYAMAALSHDAGGAEAGPAPRDLQGDGGGAGAAAASVSGLVGNASGVLAAPPLSGTGGNEEPIRPGTADASTPSILPPCGSDATQATITRVADSIRVVAPADWQSGTFVYPLGERDAQVSEMLSYLHSLLPQINSR